MKLFSVTFLLSALVLASLQVAASPIRIIEISTSRASKVTPFRLGHAAAFATNLDVLNGTAGSPSTHYSMTVPARAGPTKLSCKMRKQALKMSNWFRQQLGLPAIEPIYHRIHTHGLGAKVMPHHPRPIHGGAIQILPILGPNTKMSTTGQLQHSKWEFVPPHGRHHGQRFRPATFAGRLHKALMTLGPWEGRAMAFVIGCGIGSLIRMFWVLVILALRPSSACPAEGRIELVDAEVIFDEAQVPTTQPPQYEEKTGADVKPSPA